MQWHSKHIISVICLMFLLSQTQNQDAETSGRKLPILERSSVLRDSLEDFVSPSTSRHINYNMLKDAKKPKKPKQTRGRATRKKLQIDESVSEKYRQTDRQTDRQKEREWKGERVMFMLCTMCSLCVYVCVFRYQLFQLLMLLLLLLLLLLSDTC